MLNPRQNAVRSDAAISDCGRYRYLLTRTWDDRLPSATFVMLNPSTADASQDDPTLRRTIGYARDWNLGGVTVVNLYALRATSPAELWRNSDPVGPENDSYLLFALDLAKRAGAPIVAAWGAEARADRIAAVVGMDHDLLALATTKDGQPRHPLYLRRDLRPTRWSPP